MSPPTVPPRGGCSTPTLPLCPFCGCAAALHEHGNIFDGLSGFRVECEGVCHAMTCYWHTAAEAVVAWRRRPAASPYLRDHPPRERAEAALDTLCNALYLISRTTRDADARETADAALAAYAELRR